jgi:hypothetical protein
MNRSVVAKDGLVEMNVESTAIAFVTLHPVLSPVGGEDYDLLVQTIRNCNGYQAV